MYYCISISMNNTFEQTYCYGVDNSPFSSASITYYCPIPIWTYEYVCHAM